MNNVPEDILFEIMKNFECIEDLSSFCLISKRHYQVYLNRMNSILKHYLNYFEVNYKDPTNFIYLANDVDYSDYFNEIDSKVNYEGIFKLYMESYYDEDIYYGGGFLGDYCRITSFPIYPNMIDFNVDVSELTTFPVQPEMTCFGGYYNDIEILKNLPGLSWLYYAK